MANTPTLSRTSLAKKMAQNTDLTQDAARAALDAALAGIEEHLEQGGIVTLREFGSFSVRMSKELQLSKAMGGGLAPAQRRVHFKTSRNLKQVLNND